MRLKTPQIPLQKIGWLPCPPLSFPSLPHWDSLENTGPQKAVKGHDQETIYNSLKQAEELNWCKHVGTEKQCGHLDIVRLLKLEGAQILQKFESKREKKDKDGVLFLQSRSENFFAFSTSKID